MSDSIKEDLLERFKKINSLIRDLEDFCLSAGIKDLESDKIYVAAVAQRNLIKKILKI